MAPTCLPLGRPDLNFTLLSLCIAPEGWAWFGGFRTPNNMGEIIELILHRSSWHRDRSHGDSSWWRRERRWAVVFAPEYGAVGVDPEPKDGCATEALGLFLRKAGHLLEDNVPMLVVTEHQHVAQAEEALAGSSLAALHTDTNNFWRRHAWRVVAHDDQAEGLAWLLKTARA